MQITAHAPTVLGVEIEMLRAALDVSKINAAVTQYWRVSVVELTESTQSDLVSAVRQGSSRNGDVLVAEFQSAGRGRLGRTFNAPKSTALLFSFYIEPQRTRDAWGWIPLVAGVSVAQTLTEFGAKLKWPNDVLVKDKKISGLIAETTELGVVIGIGINVGMQKAELPVESATSLFIEGAKSTSRNLLLAEFLKRFEENYILWDRGSDEIRETYLALSATIGQEVRVEYPDGRTETAVAESVSSTGQLVLGNGAFVHAGDIIHLRLSSE